MKLVCSLLCYVMVSLTLAQQTTDPRHQEKQDLSGEILHELKKHSKTSDLYLDKMNSMEDRMKSMEENINSIEDGMKSMENKMDSVEDLIVTGVPCNCLDLQKKGITKNGVYTIYVHTDYNSCINKPIQVYCDMETDGGGWLVFQRRADGSENFYRGWNDYKEGFGDMNNEFWMGNENLYQILNTCGNQHELRVDLEDFSNETRYAQYSTFNIENEVDNYRLRLGGYSGNAGDSLSSHNGHQFTTLDKDNDVSTANCAALYKGAWWYTSCHSSNLNGLYLKGNHASYADGVNWSPWKGQRYSLKFTEMKIRPK